MIAGITVALVLIPSQWPMPSWQVTRILWSLRLFSATDCCCPVWIFTQLATGPVAVVSLLTAASLQPLAAVGSEGFIAYAVPLAVLVGIFQMSLGLLRLGVVVDLLSYPLLSVLPMPER